ncbi:MAG: 4-hydroxybenzoate octaprenyltransferase [Euryarchaeota archaeon]|nr:4-hydroxybenzoate octaprenyltransferase [Euryarchaeota archaeon]
MAPASFIRGNAVMDVKQILSFIKIEHTLFSLPFVFIGANLASQQNYSVSSAQLLWILIAAVGARGLAMGLNRITDREIDAANPRTRQRHLAAGTMSLSTAYGLCGMFLAMLLVGAWQLNSVALSMAWLPVLAFVAYPYMKRFTWGCHFWLGLCLGLAPAGAWLGIVGADLGWDALTGTAWYPEILFTSLGVLLWIASFDLGYALMDIDSDVENGIHSFPAAFGPTNTVRTMGVLTLIWTGLFFTLTPISILVGAIILGTVYLAHQNHDQFQAWWFRCHVATGWILLAGMQLS